MILITPEPLSIAALLADSPPHPCCGAHMQFAGVVRNLHVGRGVQAIDYECYEPMARRELAQIMAEARARWPVHQVAIAHRVGRLAVGEIALWMLVTAPHRGEAFAAMQYVIDQLKRRVPIWKREWYADGSSDWITCRH